MNVLITGASGFLGSFLALRWQALGHRIGLLLRPSSALTRLHGQEHAFEIGRCATDADVDAFIKQIQPDLVAHAACAYGRNGESHLQLMDANVRLGLVVLQALATLGRSASFLNMATALGPDVNAYALSKHQFAQWGRLLATQQGGTLAFLNVRLQHFYGPGDDRSKFTSHVLHSCHNNQPVLDLTAGEQLRDFVYVDDVVAALTLIAEQRATFGPTTDIDVGSGVAHSIQEFALTARRLTQSKTQLKFGAIPFRDSEVMHSVANIAGLSALGWRAKFDLESGLRRYIELEFSPGLELGRA